MFNLSFNAADLQILDEALINMPYKKVAGLIDNINKQIEAQQKPEKNQNK